MSDVQRYLEGLRRRAREHGTTRGPQSDRMMELLRDLTEGRPMEVKRYRKKPVVIEAFQWLGGDYSILDRFCGQNWGRADAKDEAWDHEDDEEQVVLWNVLERCYVPCPVGHWVIRGVKGEFYPCAPDVFAATYELVDD